MSSGKYRKVFFITIAAFWIAVLCLFLVEKMNSKKYAIKILPSSSSQVSPSPATSAPPSTEPVKKKTFDELVAEYKDIPVIDAHNHNSANEKHLTMKESWDNYGIDRVVLFGQVSTPGAVETDNRAWKAYLDDPERFIPFTTGVNLVEESGIEQLKVNLEKGFFGLGEIAAASQFSPLLATAAWKTEHPMDGVLPQIYELLAEYKAPVLLHIDPIAGVPLAKLKEALDAYPDTTFILAHANAHNSPFQLEKLLENHPNLYADFFAGFTEYNAESENELIDFVPIIQKYSDRFLVSTDSGFGIGNEVEAIDAIYRLFDALGDRGLAQKIGYDNIERLIKQQPATQTQLEAIKKLGGETVARTDLGTLTKLEAGRILNQAS
ncbi:amidohydrolase family protein [Paenibacillus sp. GCM10027627]|uniref:amidohydrolase family protein n=1 Tax=unclassified Paenibacillus TaxID=185978 RepID=UPI0036395802